MKLKRFETSGDINHSENSKYSFSRNLFPFIYLIGKFHYFEFSQVAISAVFFNH